MDQEKINQFREEQAKLKKEQAKAQLSIDNSQKIKSSVDNSTIQSKVNAEQISTAVNKGAAVTAEEVKKSSGNILSALQDNSSNISDALNNLVVATVMSRDPELVNVVSNFTELLSSLSNASDKLGKSPLNEIPTINKQLTKALQDFVKLKSSKDEPDYTKAFDSLQKAIEKLDIKPVINVPKQEIKIDLKPVENLLKEVKDAVSANEITIPETNLDGVIVGLKAVQDTITNLRFPVPNFMLPFRNNVGKDSQVQLNADGSLPVTVVSGGSGGSGDGAILDGVNSAIKATVLDIGTQLTTNDNGLVTNTVMHGLSTAGGGSYVDVKVRPSGALVTDNTIADGDDVATGATADAANTTGTTGTVSGKLRGIVQNQTNGNQQVQGNVASGATDSGNPVKAGGKYNATLPTLTDGQRGDLQVDTRGALRTILSTTNSTTSIGSRVDNADAVAGSATADNLKVSSRQTVWNGTTWDRMPGDTTGIKIQDGGNSITVDGAVTVTTPAGSIATDETLTGGFVKSIVRGGDKGTTTAADVTSTTGGANRQALDVQIYHSGTAKDPTQIRALTSSDVVTSNIGTTNGLALDATLTGGTQTTRVTDGTNAANVLKSDNTSAGKNAVMTAQTAYDTTFTTTVAGNFATTDMTNYGSVSVHLTSAGTSSTVTPQWSNDNTNWVGGTFTQINTGIGSATTSTTSGAMVLYTAKHGRYFRINVSGISAGTTAGSLHFSTAPTSYQSVGGSVTATVAAVGATGSSVPSSAIYNGYRAATALPTAATAGNTVGAMSDKYGRLVTVNGTIRDLVGTQTTTITASTSETTVVTAAASTFNDLTAITVANTSTTPARVDFRNTTAGSVIFSLYVPGSDVRGITFQRPVPQASVNTNWTAQSATSVTDLRVFAVYDKNA